MSRAPSNTVTAGAEPIGLPACGELATIEIAVEIRAMQREGRHVRTST
jgi:hypothetical protein